MKEELGDQLGEASSRRGNTMCKVPQENSTLSMVRNSTEVGRADGK